MNKKELKIWFKYTTVSPKCRNFVKQMNKIIPENYSRKRNILSDIIQEDCSSLDLLLDFYKSIADSLYEFNTYAEKGSIISDYSERRKIDDSLCEIIRELEKISELLFKKEVAASLNMI